MMGKRRSVTAATRSDMRPAVLSQQERSDDEETSMIHPSDAELTRPGAVREGQLGPVTCAACGCRLSASGDAWYHFRPMGGRDARGCRIACADAAHDASGRAISLAV
jgi:hypothetical protein